VSWSFGIRQHGTIRHYPDSPPPAIGRASRAVSILQKRTFRPVASEEAAQVSDFVPT